MPEGLVELAASKLGFSPFFLCCRAAIQSCTDGPIMAAELPSSPAEVEALLTSAVSSRASYIKKESETITLASVRRLLETDLGLEKFALDPHKAFVRQLVDEVLISGANDEPKDEGEDQANGDVQESEEVADDVPEVKHKKKVSRKKKRQDIKEDEEDERSEGSQEEAPKKKQKKEKIRKVKKETKEEQDESHQDASEQGSDGSEGQAPQREPAKNVVKSKKLEHLKKILKACGLNVSPSIYKKAKQEPEDKRDSFLVREMESILERHGLSSNPTDKEIKAVKRKIAREKDLEGIDMTNIITEPRGRRSASQPFPPVYKPPVVEEHDSEGYEDYDDDADNAAQSSEDESDEE